MVGRSAAPCKGSDGSFESRLRGSRWSGSCSPGGRAVERAPGQRGVGCAAVSPLLAFLPGEVALPIEQLRQAVPGLAGISGLLLFPMLGAWMRLLLEAMEWGRPGINRSQRISGMSVVRAMGLTTLFLFFVFTTVRAAGELRSIQAEAPFISSTLQGMAVGIGFWALYALGLSALVVDVRRRRTERRMGGVLR